MPASTAVNDTASTADREIATTRVFDAPRELVFRMFTDPDHVGRWWGPRGFSVTTHEIDVRPGGVWRFVMHGPDGTDYDNEILYLEIEPPSRLTYTHGPTPVFDTTVTFEDVDGEKTKLTMRAVFVSAEVRNQIVEQYNAVEGMHETLDRLGEELAKNASEPPFVISRTFDAPRELVFELWTGVKHLERWFGPVGFTTFGTTNDLRPGGVFHYGMRGPDGYTMWGRWEYREIVPPSKLVFISSFSDEQGGITRAPFSDDWPLQTLSTVTFTESGGRTTVTLEGLPLNANATERAMFLGFHPSMQGGWSGTLDQLGSYLAQAVRS